MKVAQSWPTLCHSPWNSPGRNTGVGSLSLLQGVFPTQELNPGLLHCRWILYQLSHKGSPRILEWVAYSFSSRSSRPRSRTRVSCIAGGFFTNWAMRDAPIKLILYVHYISYVMLYVHYISIKVEEKRKDENNILMERYSCIFLHINFSH